MIRTPRVLTFGETMGLAISTGFGSFAHAPDARMAIGGSETNVAIGLRRLDVGASWIGRVGDDAFGELIARELRAEEVDATTIVDPTHTTGFMVKERRRPHHTRVTYYRSGSAGSQLTSADLPLDRIGRWDHLHVTGITLALGAEPLRAVRDAIDAARAAGVTTSFDLNYRSQLWGPDAATAAYRELVPLCDVVFAGEDEARLLTGHGDPSTLASAVQRLGPRVAVVKLGPAGAVARIDDELHTVQGRKVDVLDTVGAGDGFVAGFLSEWVDGEAPDRCLATAVTVGAFACLGPGDWETLPRRQELESLDEDPVQR